MSPMDSVRALPKQAATDRQQDAKDMEHAQKPAEKAAEQIAATRAEAVELLTGAVLALLLSGRTTRVEVEHHPGDKEYIDDVAAA